MKKEIIIDTVQKLRDELSLTELPVNLNKFFEHFDNLDIIYDVERDHLLDGNIHELHTH